MWWLRFVPMLVVLAACGGSASFDPSGAKNVAGAAGEAGAEAGGSASADGASGGGAGGAPASAAGGAAGGARESAGASNEAGAGASGADGGNAGAGGQASLGCEGLECLAGAELVYWPDREWQPASNPASFELLESDYKPKMGSPWDVKFSADALQIVLTPRDGGNAVQGSRDPQQVDRAWFMVMLPAGGRFVVQGALPQFQAELTAYGSGLPVVQSTRGVLQARP